MWWHVWLKFHGLLYISIHVLKRLIFGWILISRVVKITSSKHLETIYLMANLCICALRLYCIFSHRSLWLLLLTVECSATTPAPKSGINIKNFFLKKPSKDRTRFPSIQFLTHSQIHALIHHWIDFKFSQILLMINLMTY